MKIIKADIHAILDYVVVAFLWLSPSLFGFTDLVKTFTYILGGIHLALTLITDFKGGVVKLVPLKFHGIIELIVSIVLVAGAWLFPNANQVDRYFYTGFGIAVFLTWLLTEYESEMMPVK